MKSSVKLIHLKMFFATLLFSCFQLVLLAQDSTSTATSTTTTSSNTRVNISENGEWYTSPWVWLVGAAVFILLLVALLRGGGNNRRSDTSQTDRVTVTKTVREERDTDTV
jgi:ABC-type Fe3+ transport system permease subunit